jgi:hypothetical protein
VPELTYQVASPFWQFVDHWQTLITGVLALFAGLGTIWATIASARREIAANQAQTKVAQDQLATTLRLERRRIVREGWAFFAMVEAAMGAVVMDVNDARSLLHDPTAVRQRVHKAAFPELRSAFLHFGGVLTAKVLELEREIDDYAARFMEVPTATVGILMRVGVVGGISDELDRIEALASNLRDEASEAMKEASAVLAETEDH